MCSPELTKGMCGICCGTLTPENTHVDRWGNAWDVHRGVCAMMAGEIPYRHGATYARFMERLDKASTQFVRNQIIKSLNKWIIDVADENHFWTGPE